MAARAGRAAPHRLDAIERTLQKDWGTMVVGGYIDELQTVCRTGFFSADYETRVKLRVVFADPQRNDLGVCTAAKTEPTSSRAAVTSTQELSGRKPD